jgi:HAD superfamily hydrolase (TIGR01509 family)
MKAILFDNDGVLADSESIFFRTTREAFAAEGVALDADTWGRLYLTEGKRSAEVAAALGLTPARADQVLRRRNRAFRRRLASGVRLRPHVRRTLKSLHRRLRLALVTGAPRRQLELIHRSTGLLPYFECIVTSDECEREKPHPEAYLQALQRLELPPDECLAVEDSPRGVAAAAAAGLRCVVIPTPLTRLAACGAAWMRLQNVGELLDLVDRPAPR